jgi:hypothetical protein
MDWKPKATIPVFLGILYFLLDLPGRLGVLGRLYSSLPKQFHQWVFPAAALCALVTGIVVALRDDPKKVEARVSLLDHREQPIPQKSTKKWLPLTIAVSLAVIVGTSVILAVNFRKLRVASPSDTHPTIAPVATNPSIPPKPTTKQHLVARKKTVEFKPQKGTACDPAGGKIYTDYLSLPGGPQLQRPMVVINTGSSPFGAGQINDDTLIVFELVLTNRGEASIIKNWELCILHDNKPLIYQTAPIPTAGLSIAGTNERILPEQSLVDSAIKTPIEHAHTAGGWVAFRISGTELLKLWASGKEIIRGSIRYKDYLDHTYSFPFDGPGTFSKPTMDLYLPGAPQGSR